MSCPKISQSGSAWRSNSVIRRVRLDKDGQVSEVSVMRCTKQSTIQFHDRIVDLGTTLDGIKCLAFQAIKKLAQDESLDHVKSDAPI